jgi:hypothetical protein
VESGGKEGEGSYFAREIENEGEGAGAPGRAPKAGLGHAVGRANFPILDLACF